jgi:hypothetical protein
VIANEEPASPPPTTTTSKLDDASIAESVHRHLRCPNTPVATPSGVIGLFVESLSAVAGLGVAWYVWRRYGSTAEITVAPT